MAFRFIHPVHLADQLFSQIIHFISFQVILPPQQLDNEFLINGKVNLEQGCKRKFFSKWGPQFQIEFDIMVYNLKNPLAGYLNVLEMKTDTVGEFGNYIPSIYLIGKDIRHCLNSNFAMEKYFLSHC